MRSIHFSIIALLPLLIVSCGKKESAKTADAAQTVAADVTTDGVVLAEKNHIPPVGTILTRVSSSNMEDAIMKVRAGAREMEGTATQTSSSEDTIEILSPDKIRVNTISKKTGGKMSMNGNEQPAGGKTDPLEGHPVIMERKGGSWTATLESGKEPEGEQAVGLTRIEKVFNRDSEFQMYGDTPRKVGDKWDVDPADLSNFGGMEDVSGSYSNELVSLEEFQGKKCAVVKSTFEIKGLAAGEAGGPSLDMSFKGTAVTRRSIEDMVDLDAAVEGTMSFSGSPNPNVKIEIEGHAIISEKITVGKK